MMFLNTLLLNVWHPGRYLPPGTHTFLALDGLTERVGPGWEDKRPLLLKMFDFCDLVGLVTGRDKKNRYWEWEPAELEAYVARQKAEKAEKKRKWKGRMGRLVPWRKKSEGETAGSDKRANDGDKQPDAQVGSQSV